VSAVLQPAVHTSVPEADLFVEAPAANDVRPRGNCTMAFTGQLLHHAEVRVKQLDHQGLHVPVVCLELEHVGAGHHHVHAEIPFTEATRHEADALAKGLRKHQTVTVTTALSDVRVFLPAAAISTH
jgi:hypothetical protein